ncbi:GDNF-inducible zinc finger protein 1-like isoform X11 [Harpegnathos saltator]|uniref:GDNF-inducible zinc finger protein 1-like isoform X11 n=1 Tax=Harpegnathos saltator TaxID=610380 RepID=UPI000DBECF6B|nr:GDNF-inducible zinc finger protein 1-like isoform X11 [Harpegnathos saltator]
MSSADCSDLCRLCLVKERVTVPIFEGEGDARRIFTKISTCLPVKISREDKLPQKLCADCVYKVETFFEFWQTTAVSEKRLQAWLADVEKQDYAVATVLNQSGMKGEQSNENRLDGSGMMQQVSGHQNSLNMVMDNMGMCMSMMMPNNQQQITSVPMDPSGSSVQSIQVVAGSSTHEQITHDQIIQNQTNAPTQQEEEEESSEDEENSDDECDGDGLPIKEESEEDPNNSRTIEPTTFVNVSLACEDPGPSGLQQQKMADIQEMTTAGDPKTGMRGWWSIKCKKYLEVTHDSIIIAESTFQEINRERRDNDPVSWSKQTKQEKDTRRKLCIEKEEKEKEEEEEKKEKEEEKEEKKVSEDSSSEEEETKSTVKASSSENSSTDEDRSFTEMQTTCPFCSKHFDRLERLKKHITAIHKRGTYKCDQCRATYYTERNLEEHRKSHSDDYFFKCDVCHLKYKRKITLQHHQVRAHSDATAQFICDYCGQGFKVRIDLLLHIKRRHNYDIHICRYCGKSVTDVCSHESKHRKRAGEKTGQLSCHLCVKKFQNQTRLDNHLLLHKKGYKCDECDVVASSSSKLQYHKNRKHKPGMTCPICKKVFMSKNFHQHVLTHAGTRPYKCDICNEDFTQRSSLFRHRRNHPGPLPVYKSQKKAYHLAERKA